MSSAGVVTALRTFDLRDMLQRLAHELGESVSVIDERLDLLDGSIDLRRLVAEVRERAAKIIERSDAAPAVHRTVRERFLRELLRQLEHDARRGLLADAGDLREPSLVTLRDGTNQIV